MRKLFFFFTAMLICTSVWADKENIRLRLLNQVNGPTCRHVHVENNDTGEVLEVTTVDDLRAAVNKHRDSFRIRQIKRRILTSGATTPAEIRTAVQGMEVDDEL